MLSAVLAKDVVKGILVFGKVYNVLAKSATALLSRFTPRFNRVGEVTQTQINSIFDNIDFFINQLGDALPEKVARKYQRKYDIAAERYMALQMATPQSREYYKLLKRVKAGKLLKSFTKLITKLKRKGLL